MAARFSASAIFCDDVRNEVGGKSTIVGVYRGFMAVQEPIPFVPRVVALVMFEYSKTEQGKTAKVKLLDRGAPLIEAEFELEASPQWPAELEAAGVGDAIYMQVPLELLAYPAPNGATLCISLEVDDFQFVSQELKVIRVAQGFPRDSLSFPPVPATPQ